MKRKIISLLVLGTVAISVGLALIQASPAEQQDKRIQVAASYYPLYEFVKQVGGDKVSVSNLTPAGAEPHDYEPSAKALADTVDADVFVYNGGPFEPWTDRFVRDFQHQVVQASKGIALADAQDHHDEIDQSDKERHAKDPHFWLDPVLAQRIVVTIRNGLAEADPDNAGYYAERAAALGNQLAMLDKDFRSGLQSCRNDTIVVSHGAFGYVAKRYGFAVESIAGVSPDMEPSAARMAELSDHVRDEGIQYIFFERLVSPRLAATIAQETGARTLVLDPIEGLSNEEQEQGKDYFSIQRENLAHLRTALACQ